MCAVQRRCANQQLQCTIESADVLLLMLPLHFLSERESSSKRVVKSAEREGEMSLRIGGSGLALSGKK